MSTWAIRSMGSEDNTGELYAVTRDGALEISRVPLWDALEHVRAKTAAADKVEYNGEVWTGYQWLQRWGMP